MRHAKIRKRILTSKLPQVVCWDDLQEEEWQPFLKIEQTTTPA